MIKSTVPQVARNRFEGSLLAMSRNTGINRATLTKYRQDHDGKNHMMIMRDNQWLLFTLVKGQR